ncbi:MAG: hypothetical protein ABR507_04090 [Actinomycetota bacterium]|nr:hypothetical protein [Actinomycetota bacterium]
MKEQPDVSPQRRKRNRILLIAVLVVIGLPILFYLFEYVVPSLLPSNF